jgi:hypothetical protein
VRRSRNIGKTRRDRSATRIAAVAKELGHLVEDGYGGLRFGIGQFRYRLPELGVVGVKVSGRLASDDVTQDRLDIRSYIDTARKHGKNALAVLYDLMTGKPWRPPAQAFSP